MIPKTLPQDFKLTQLSGDQQPLPFAIAVFAYNEAKTIQAALHSIVDNTKETKIAIYVLANGCRDSTAEKVRESASSIDNLWLVETPIADKASTWNLFVHEVLTPEQVDQMQVCFFMDGDITLTPGTLPKLVSALDETPSAEAAGALPATGRDRDAWRQRMVLNNVLAGNCYALRNNFLQQLRARDIRMPAGLIGEDFFVSWLVSNNPWHGGPLIGAGPQCVFRSDAEFAFRSLSPWRWSDIRTYMWRKWRYTLRGIQHQMLLLVMSKGLGAMPRDVKELYCEAPIPSRLQWCGIDTPLHFFAVQWIRSLRAKTQTLPK